MSRYEAHLAVSVVYYIWDVCQGMKHT
jgi:hypothetical protein